MTFPGSSPGRGTKNRGVETFVGDAIWHLNPTPTSDGKNYFADFYLPDHDVYLDPKNSYKAKLDTEKIASVIEENEIKLFVVLKDQLTTEWLRSILDMQSTDNR